MDFATITGLGLGALLIMISIALGTGFGAFIDVPSILVTIGGTIAATLISFSMKSVLGVVTLVKQTIVVHRADPVQTIRLFTELAGIARREGLIALEPKLEEVQDPFLVKGLTLVIDGAAPEAVRAVLETDVGALDERHTQGKKILDFAGAAGPAWGMIGTLMGLVQMLQNLDDPSKIGGGMAIALLTTFYGAVLANLVCIPLAQKLDTKHGAEMAQRALALEGISSLQAGDNPRLLEDKLSAFLPPAIRAALQAEKAEK